MGGQVLSILPAAFDLYFVARANRQLEPGATLRSLKIADAGREKSSDYPGD